MSFLRAHRGYSPEGFIVNDDIPEALCSLSYVTINDTIQKILAYGWGTLLAKVYICNAYRTVPVHLDDRWLMGMSPCLWISPLRSAPKIFTAVADAAEYILHLASVKFVIHYLDDFLIHTSVPQLYIPYFLHFIIWVYQ